MIHGPFIRDSLPALTGAFMVFPELPNSPRTGTACDIPCRITYSEDATLPLPIARVLDNR